MKKTKYIKWFIPVALLAIIYGCTDLDELNKNPTQSTNLDPNLQITTIEVFYSGQSERVWRYFIYPAGFMNQWAGDYSVDEFGSIGKSNANYFAMVWDSFYKKIIPNAVDVVERTKDDPAYANVNAIGRILKVMYFQRLTDYFGDIPYFNAGKAYYTGVLTTTYDKQEDIYKDFFSELDIAANQLNANGGTVTGDLYYNGDIAKWKKFANSLKLRIAMRLVKVNPSLAQQKAQEAINGGVFTSNDDVCYVKHDNVASNPAASEEAGEGPGNAFSYRLNQVSTSEYGSYLRPTADLIGAIEASKNDPRVRMLAASYTTDASRTDITDLVRAQKPSYQAMSIPRQTKIGNLNTVAPGTITINIGGVPTAIDSRAQFLQPSKKLTAYDAPYINMTYAEVEFLQAEFKVRWGGGVTAAQPNYKNGMKAAVEQLRLYGMEVPAGSADAFALATENELQTATAYNQIGTQLWILHFLDPIETWATWRRLDKDMTTFFPYTLLGGNETGPNPSKPGEALRPRRLPYPSDEQTKNTASWREAVDRMPNKLDSWLNRVWWDKE